MNTREAILSIFGTDTERLRKFIELSEEIFKPELLAEAKAILAELESKKINQ